MKKWLPLFLICLITFISLTPKVGIFAYTENDYYNAIGAYYLGNLIVSGNSSELDFSNGEGDEDFLLALGEAIATGDYTNLAQWGLNTLDDTITDIKEFIQTSVYNVNPDIYDFLYSDSNVKINLSDGHITKNLFVQLQNNLNPTPSPTPDANYLSYINCINGSTPWGNLVPHSFFENGVIGSGNLQHQINNVTLYSHPSQYPNFTKSQISDYYISACAVGSNIATIYINSSENGYWITDFQKPLDNTSFFYTWNSPSYTAFGTFNSNGIGMATNGMGATSYTYKTVNFQAYYQTLDDLFTFLVQTVRNVNIYVDDIPWSLVSSSEPNEPIELGNNLTILNNYPARYYYDTPIYFDMNGLITRIVNAIQSKNVLTYQDIEDLIYDVNGNSVIGVLNFYRTDYDILASEQIPYYPNFYYDNNLNQYVQVGANIINISTEILPRDVLNIIITSGVILLFGYVIRRLLE